MPNPTENHDEKTHKKSDASPRFAGRGLCRDRFERFLFYEWSFFEEWMEGRFVGCLKILGEFRVCIDSPVCSAFWAVLFWSLFAEKNKIAGLATMGVHGDSMKEFTEVG